MRRIAFLAALTPILVVAAAPLAAQQVERRTQGAATMEDVPAIPPEVKAAVQRYQNSRGAGFADFLPDGGILIATRFGATAQLHRVAQPLAMRSQLTFFDEPVAAAEAIPGTDLILFGRDTGGDEWFQLYTLAPDGSTRQLTEAGTRNGSPVFKRDGTRVFWSQAVKGSGDRTILSANPKDPKTRKVVAKLTGAVETGDVSPDGKTLLLVESPSNLEDRLSLYDVATGKRTPLAEGPRAVFQGAQFARNGRAVLALSNRGSDNRRLVEIDVANGTLTPISPEMPWDVEDFDIDRDGRVLAYAVNEDGFSRLVVQDFRTRRALPQPVLPKGVLTGLKVADGGERIAVGLSSATAPSDIWVLPVAGGAPVRWTQSELGPIDPARLPEPELVRFKSFDGLSIPAFVYRPKGVPKGRKTPVLIEIHGGPESQARPGWNPRVAFWTEQLGATVIVPNVRGSDGYGTRYIDMDNGPKREDSVRDIGALIDWARKQPGLDGDRMAVYGGSYGGYMSLATMTHYSDKLAGGVNLFGIANWTTFLEKTEAYRRDNRRSEYGDERSPEMQAVFAKISPVNNVARITKPMLIEQGANDPRVPQGESEQMVAALRQRGVPVSYLLFADEGHGWRKKPNADLAREVETVFLQRVLNTGATTSGGK